MPEPTKYAAVEVKFPFVNINPIWVYKYWQQRKFIDLHIYTNDSKRENPIYAHRIVIGSSSIALHNLLNNSIDVASGHILEMKIDGVSRTTMDILVNAIYSGLVEGLTDNNVLELLSAAQELALHDIQAECENYLKEKIGLDKCLKILSIAEDTDLIHNCSHMVLTQLDLVKVNSNLSQLDENVMRLIINKGITTNLCSPLDLLSLVISWLTYDWSRLQNGLELVGNLLPLLDMNNIVQILPKLLKLDYNQDDKKFKLEFMSKVFATMATSSSSASSSSSTEEGSEEEMTPIIVGTRSLSPQQTIQSPRGCLDTFHNNNYYATMTDDHMLPVSTQQVDPITSNPAVSNLRNLPSFRLPFYGNDGTIATRSCRQVATCSHTSPAITTSLLSPASLIDSAEDDQSSVSTVCSSSSTTTTSTTNNNNNSMSCDEAHNKLPKFFYLAGILASTRRLRSCDLEENGYKDEAPFTRSKCMDNCIVYHDNKVYVLGGQDGTNTSSEVHIYDLLKKRWSLGPCMTEGRCEFNTIVMDGYIYALGADQPVEVEVLDNKGRKKGKRIKRMEWQGTNSVERLKIYGRTSKQPRKWEAVECMIYCRHNCGLAVLDNKLYAIGGNGAANGERMEACASAECFDPSDTTDKRGQSADKWTLKAPMKTRRIGLCTVAAWGKIYAMGGGSAPYNEKQKKIYKTIEIYDPINDCWRFGPSMNRERQFFGGFLHNDHIYVVGGDSHMGKGSTIERLELAQNRWSIVGYVGDATLDDGQYWSVALQA